MGEALADVLLGAAEPGGRLPVTLPAAEADCPVLEAVPDGDGVLPYAEGLLIGYRGYDASGIEPRYPFGHGLGYTTWAYESLDGGERPGRGARPGRDRHRSATPGPGPAGRWSRPTWPRRRASPGGRSGRWPRSARRSPSRARGPGCGSRLPARSFARWDERAGGWVWPAGRFQVQRGPLGPRPAADRRGAVRLSPRPGPRGRAGLRPTAIASAAARPH